MLRFLLRLGQRRRPWAEVHVADDERDWLRGFAAEAAAPLLRQDRQSGRIGEWLELAKAALLTIAGRGQDGERYIPQRPIRRDDQPSRGEDPSARLTREEDIEEG